MGDNSFVHSFVARPEETKLPHPRLSYLVIYVLIEGLTGKRPSPFRSARPMQPNAYLNEAEVCCRGGKDGCDSAMVSTIPIIALLRAAGFAETAMVNGCEHFAFNVVPYNLNLNSDNARFSNLRLQIINETMATDTSRNRIYLILAVQSRMYLMQTRP